MKMLLFAGALVASAAMAAGASAQSGVTKKVGAELKATMATAGVNSVNGKVLLKAGDGCWVRPGAWLTEKSRAGGTVTVAVNNPPTSSGECPDSAEVKLDDKVFDALAKK